MAIDGKLMARARERLAARKEENERTRERRQAEKGVTPLHQLVKKPTKKCK